MLILIIVLYGTADFNWVKQKKNIYILLVYIIRFSRNSSNNQPKIQFKKRNSCASACPFFILLISKINKFYWIKQDNSIQPANKNFYSSGNIKNQLFKAFKSN